MLASALTINTGDGLPQNNAATPDDAKNTPAKLIADACMKPPDVAKLLTVTGAGSDAFKTPTTGDAESGGGEWTRMPDLAQQQVQMVIGEGAASMLLVAEEPRT